MPSSIREELNRLEFDWENGEMVTQDGTGLQPVRSCYVVGKEHPMLDVRFSNGSGYLDLARFMAADSLAVYIPYRDSHGSGLRKIYHEPAEYIERGEAIPYPEA